MVRATEEMAERRGQTPGGRELRLGGQGRLLREGDSSEEARKRGGDAGEEGGLMLTGADKGPLSRHPHPVSSPWS